MTIAIPAFAVLQLYSQLRGEVLALNQPEQE